MVNKLFHLIHFNGQFGFLTRKYSLVSHSDLIDFWHVLVAYQKLSDIYDIKISAFCLRQLYLLSLG